MRDGHRHCAVVLLPRKEVGIPQSGLAPVVADELRVLLDLPAGLHKVHEVLYQDQLEVILLHVRQGHPGPPVWLLGPGPGDHGVLGEGHV